jgi:hypothetical protein
MAVSKPREPHELACCRDQPFSSKCAFVQVEALRKALLVIAEAHGGGSLLSNQIKELLK